MIIFKMSAVHLLVTNFLYIVVYLFAVCWFIFWGCDWLCMHTFCLSFSLLLCTSCE